MPRRPPAVLLALALLCAALCMASPALAANPVIGDCTAHNKLTHHYSLTQLEAALNSLPVDVHEYTACYDVIQRQLDAQLGGTHGNGAGNGGGGSFLPVPVIVILALLIVGGVGYAGWSVYRTRGEAPEEGDHPRTGDGEHSRAGEGDPSASREDPPAGPPTTPL